MKVCDASRTQFYQLLGHVFSRMKIAPRIAEIGVLRGQNAESMYHILSPRFMWLIDPWRAYKKFHHHFEERPFYIQPDDAHEYYFGGPLTEQSTFDKIFHECQARFSGAGNIHLLRMDSISGMKTVSVALQQEKLDLIYIDGDHAYDEVLRDLMYWGQIASEDGVLMLNDCCSSEAGRAQNLGVLQAVTEFMKRSEYIPVLLTNSDWSDVVLAKKNSHILSEIDHVVLRSNLRYVEVPGSLLSSMRVVNGIQNQNISFC